MFGRSNILKNSGTKTARDVRVKAALLRPLIVEVEIVAPIRPYACVAFAAGIYTGKRTQINYPVWHGLLVPCASLLASKQCHDACCRRVCGLN
jgi:hypothetical protein